MPVGNCAHFDAPHPFVIALQVTPSMAVSTTSPTIDFARITAVPRRQGPALLPDPGQMTLRVSAPGQEGRVVQIRSAKCTIGSAAGCTLRIRARGVGALHCWILRGQSATIVRRLHGPATLNGGTFEEAALNRGDRLRIGSVELELVEANQSPPTALPVFALLPSSEADTAALRAEHQAQFDKLRTEHEAQIDKLVAERGSQIADLVAKHAEQIESLKVEHTQDVTALKAEYRAQSSSLEATHAKETGDLKGLAAEAIQLKAELA